MTDGDTFKNLSMDGKIAVVTGSTQGLGEAICNLFADRGVKGLVICGRNAARGAKVKASLEAKGVKTVFVQADLGRLAEVRKVVSACDKEFGRIDALVNAAALTDRGSIWDTTPERYDEIFDVNVKAPFFLMQEAIKLMIAKGVRGSIVNIGSMSEHAGQPFISAHCASKGALATLTRNTAFAVMGNRIRVNQLNIGWMSSDNERALQARESGDPDWEKKASAGLPFGRLIDPAEVARAAAFMASDDSGMMTGAVVNFDQSVWGAYAGQAPAPDAPMQLPA